MEDGIDTEETGREEETDKEEIAKDKDGLREFEDDTGSDEGTDVITRKKTPSLASGKERGMVMACPTGAGIDSTLSLL